MENETNAERTWRYLRRVSFRDAANRLLDFVATSEAKVSNVFEYHALKHKFLDELGWTWDEYAFERRRINAAFISANPVLNGGGPCIDDDTGLPQDFFDE